MAMPRRMVTEGSAAYTGIAAGTCPAGSPAIR
jgi:hypothetical protein